MYNYYQNVYNKYKIILMIIWNNMQNVTKHLMMTNKSLDIYSNIVQYFECVLFKRFICLFNYVVNTKGLLALDFGTLYVFFLQWDYDRCIKLTPVTHCFYQCFLDVLHAFFLFLYCFIGFKITLYVTTQCSKSELYFSVFYKCFSFILIVFNNYLSVFSILIVRNKCKKKD